MLAVTVVVLGSAVGCESTGVGPDAERAPAAVELPFGLRQVDGTKVLGRPAVYRDQKGTFDGEPVLGTRLQAVYSVTGPDPVAVFSRWVEQLAMLPLDAVGVGVGGSGGQWLVASGQAADSPGSPALETKALIELWPTPDGAVIAVDAFVQPDAVPDQPSLPDIPRAPRPPQDAGPRPQRPGDVLFEEKFDAVLMPDRARALVGTLPRSSGEGGSFSVIAAADAKRTIDNLLRQASEHAAGFKPEIVMPVPTVDGDLRVSGLSFSFGSAWSFDLVAVQEANDEEATLYISTASL